MTNALITNSGTSVDDAAVRAFTSGIKGAVITPDDAAYDEARRVFNGMIDRKPGLIARPVDTADVQRCVDFARDNNLLISVKGGGHSVQGYGVCDGGIMVDLAELNYVRVDPQARTAAAGGGATWGVFDAATQEHGLAVTGGRVPSTGIAGLTLGSGSGWLERKLGYTVDSMIGAEVVLASGEVVQASEEENAELFWGLRGGSGNFGIVTELRYRLHPIGPLVFGGLVAFPRERAAEVLKAYRDMMYVAPDDLGGASSFICAPPDPAIPVEVHGQPMLGIVVLYTGDPAEGETAFKPLLDLQPVVKMLQPMPYVALQGMLAAANPPGMQNYWKAAVLDDLPDEAIAALDEATMMPPSPMSQIIIQPLGGAVHRVADDATAMGWRASRWAIHMLGMWPDPADNDRNIAWIRNMAAKIEPWAKSGSYLNYLMDEGEERVRDSFGSQYGRMVQLKDRYDPTNLFRLNQNIRPSR